MCWDGPCLTHTVEENDGSTLITCRESIEDHVAKLEGEEEERAKAAGRNPAPLHPFGNPVSELPLMDAVALLTKIIWDSIGEVVVAARHGMALIQNIARQVSKHNLPLTWTTPTGFIVEQAIYKEQGTRIKTHIMGTIRLQINEDTTEIDPARMQSSAAPNYVHSMDASHLVKSVNGFDDAGIESIAVIHDSFGTHAGMTDVLRAVLRREFVNLYMEDRLSQFKAQVEDAMLEEVEMSVPMVGTLDLLDVLDSTYCFS